MPSEKEHVKDFITDPQDEFRERSSTPSSAIYVSSYIYDDQNTVKDNSFLPG